VKIIGRVVGALTGAFLMSIVAGAIVLAATRRQGVEVDEPEADEVHLRAVLGPIAYASRASSFRGGTIDLWYGGGIVDLREAQLDPDGATLHVRTAFGGAQLVVPEEWNVVSTVRGLGGIGDGRERFDRPADAPTLRVEGFVLFGGFGITSSIPEGAMDQLQSAMAAGARRFGERGAQPAAEAG
jgi:hypothetical protein